MDTLFDKIWDKHVVQQESHTHRLQNLLAV